MNETWLAHHGILGQRWGVRRFQNKDGTYTSAGKKRYSDKDSNKEKFWTDDRKKLAKRIAIGTAAVAGIALASYGTYKLYKNGKLDPLIDKLSQKGQNELKGVIDNAAVDHKDSLSKTSKLYSLLDNKNPTGDRDNCKDLAVTAACRANGKNVVAGHNTIKGNLHDLIEDTFGLYDKVVDIHVNKEETGDQIKSKVTSYLLRKYKEGDVGCIGISYSEYQKERARKRFGIDIDAHAFNWCIENGNVTFGCSQNGYPQNGDSFFRFVGSVLDSKGEVHDGSGKDIEILRMTEELAEKIAKHY